MPSDDSVRLKIQEGWESLRRGEGADGEEFMAQLGTELDERENRTRDK